MGYSLDTIPPAERAARRLVLDRYAKYSLALAVLPAVVAVVLRVGGWTAGLVRRRLAGGGGGGADGAGEYGIVPTSPSLKRQRQSGRGRWTAAGRRIGWWLSEEVVVFGWACGHGDEWLVGAAWLAAVAALCFLETGTDFLHLTKRFGAVATAQYPVLYALSLKWANPVGAAMGLSHERLNRWHRGLGFVVYGLLAAHTACYLVFFACAPGGTFWPRVARAVVVVGLLAFGALTLLAATSLLPAVRRWSYRLFYLVHLVAACAVPPLILYHTAHGGRFMAVALLLLVADRVLRAIHTVPAVPATIAPVPGAPDLLHLAIPLPPARQARFRDAPPAAHVFLSLPYDAVRHAARHPLLFAFLRNPFTVAAVDADDARLTLVVRVRRGPLTTFLASQATADMGVRLLPTTPLNVEGPYGCAAAFPDLSAGRFDRILLVAGGVGATFAVPLFRAVARDSPSLPVDLVWAVRAVADAAWIADLDPALLADPRVHLHVTGEDFDVDADLDSHTDDSNSRDGSLELAPLPTPPAVGRPDLVRFVDDLFHRGAEDRVAVLVCGPVAMVRDLRAAVRPWVLQGRSVWWHNEAFGW